MLTSTNYVLKKGRQLFALTLRTGGEYDCMAVYKSVGGKLLKILSSEKKVYCLIQKEDSFGIKIFSLTNTLDMELT